MYEHFLKLKRSVWVLDIDVCLKSIIKNQIYIFEQFLLNIFKV